MLNLLLSSILIMSSVILFVGGQGGHLAFRIFCSAGFHFKCVSGRLFLFMKTSA